MVIQFFLIDEMFKSENKRQIRNQHEELDLTVSVYASRITQF